MAPSSKSTMVQFSATANRFADDSATDFFRANASLDFIYLVRNGPSFGLRYFAETRNEIGIIEGGQSFGLLIGYFHQTGINLQAVYDATAKLGSWSKGTGYQADLGYIEHVGNQYHIGLKVAHRSTTYTFDELDPFAKTKTVADTFPSLQFVYLF